NAIDAMKNLIIRIIIFCLFALKSPTFIHAQAVDRPNILWISTEDHNPAIGAYGDEQARTPNMDAFAGEGILYRNAFVPSPICAPARTAIITGMYGTSLGTQHLRSNIRIPASIQTL